MERFLVTGGARLAGTVQVAGAKNSVLKLMAAALLAEGTTVITNCPEILDVPLMADVLRGLGCEVETGGEWVSITTPAELSFHADFPAVGRLRASVCVLGPLMGRCRQARVALPGGDAIGSRPLDMHQSGLRALGADMGIEHGQVVGRADKLRGAWIGLDFPSVGATENILMAAVARRRHHGDRQRGPGAGDHRPGPDARPDGRPDRRRRDRDDHHRRRRQSSIRPGTAPWATGWSAAPGPTPRPSPGARCGWRASTRSIMTAPLERLIRAGAQVEPEDDAVTVTMPERPKAVDFITMPYPGFPTDLQPMALALAAVADGNSLITENVFEARFRFVDELIRMGADARTDGHHAAIRGREQLSSAPVWSTDIRAGAGLVLAGLAAEGVTEVHEVMHIDRGYPHFVENLQKLGGQIQRVGEPEDLLHG